MLDLNNGIDRAEFGNRIKKARNKKGFTQELLGELLYCNRSTVSQWERGENLPEYGVLSALCANLSCDIGYLFGDYDEQKNVIHDTMELTGLSEEAVSALAHGLHYGDGLINIIDIMICKYSDELSYIDFIMRAAGNCKKIARENKDKFSEVGEEARKLFGGNELDIDAQVFALSENIYDEDSYDEERFIKKISIPEGTMLLAAEDAGDFYIDKIVGIFRNMVEEIADIYSRLTPVGGEDG